MYPRTEATSYAFMHVSSGEQLQMQLQMHGLREARRQGYLLRELLEPIGIMCSEI